MTPLEVGNYTSNNIVNKLRRLPGVGDEDHFAVKGRVRRDPAKLSCDDAQRLFSQSGGQCRTRGKGRN
ncbi:hypothetical protein [Sphingobium sp.]|uniref:hypothetical protein n=1 Tax=Sphingobium sp. TaxID=1912891 RepID=UPI002ED2AE18